MINFNSTYTFKTTKIKDDFIVFLERDLSIICNKYSKVLFINITTKELMLLAISELLDYKTKVDETKSQILFIPNLENYISDIQLQVINRFHHTWYNLLYDYITSNSFIEVLKEITTQSKEYIIYPDVNDRFKMFNIQNFNDIKVVFVSLDPYTSDEATGVAFASNRYKKPKSLRTIEKAIQEQFKSTSKLDNSLISLVNQGIMFLNSALTSRRHKITNQSEVGVHLQLWQPFLSFVMKELNNKSESIIFVFLGSKASNSSKFITSSIHYKVIVEHPAKASYEEREWINENLFTNINNILSLNQQDIKWI